MTKKISIKDSDTKQRKEYEKYNFDMEIVTLYSSEVQDLINQLDVKGICMYRFRGDFVTSGIDYSTLDVGGRLNVGEAKLIITKVGKPCHTKECNIYVEGKKCLLQQGTAFARVVRHGQIKIGDALERL